MLDMSQQQRVSQKQILKPAIIYLLKTEMDLLLSLSLSLFLSSATAIPSPPYGDMWSISHNYYTAYV